MGSEARCNTCTNEAWRPFHRVDEHGKTIMGCVDEFHREHVVPCTAYASWYARPEAKEIRRRMRQWMKDRR